MTKHKQHVIHRENCDNVIREIITDVVGRKVILSGMYAFEWYITICSKEKTIRKTYSNRAEALKEFNKLRPKKKRNPIVVIKEVL